MKNAKLAVAQTTEVVGVVEVAPTVVQLHNTAKTIAEKVVQGYRNMIEEFLEKPDHQKIISGNEAWGKARAKDILYKCAEAWRYQVYPPLSSKSEKKTAFIFKDNSTLIVHGDKIDFGPVISNS